MITQWFLNLLNTVIQAGINLLPTAGDLPSGINTAFSLFSNSFKLAGAIFPMGTVFTILTLVITIELAIFAFEIWDWLYHKIRG